MADSDKDADKLENSNDDSQPGTDGEISSSDNALESTPDGKSFSDDDEDQSDGNDVDELDSLDGSKEEPPSAQSQQGDDDEYGDARPIARDAPAQGEATISPLLIGVFALAVGVGGGWFGHQMKEKTDASAADAAVEGQGEAAKGPCKDWETKICAELGDKAFACNQAKSSSALLPGSACQIALKSVPQTVAQVRAARASCETITSKLCGELGEETKSCELVKTQTPSFPPAKCDEMMKNYDKILSQLKTREQRGGRPDGRPPGHPGMGRRPGPPGALPPGATRPPQPPKPTGQVKVAPSKTTVAATKKDPVKKAPVVVKKAPVVVKKAPTKAVSPH